MTTKRKINILTLFVIVLLLLIIFLYNKVYYAEQLVDKTNKVLVVENENLSDYNKAILNKAKKRYSDNGYSTKQYIEYVNKVSSSIDTCIALVQKMKTTVNDDENLKLKLSKIRELFIDENYYSTYINRFNILFNSETLNFYLKNDRFKRKTNMKILETYNLNGIYLKNRIVMAPISRGFAGRADDQRVQRRGAHLAGAECPC